jgi:hypothetical protein
MGTEAALGAAESITGVSSISSRATPICGNRLLGSFWRHRRSSVRTCVGVSAGRALHSGSPRRIAASVSLTSRTRAAPSVRRRDPAACPVPDTPLPCRRIQARRGFHTSQDGRPGSMPSEMFTGYTTGLASNLIGLPRQHADCGSKKLHSFPRGTRCKNCDPTPVTSANSRISERYIACGTTM